jgi:hypothetical protein
MKNLAKKIPFISSMLESWLKVTDLDEYTTTMHDNITNTVLQPNNNWVRIPVTLRLSIRKGKLSSHFLFDHSESTDIHLCCGVCTLLEGGPSGISPISLSCDSYGIQYKNQTILCFALRIPNFALQIYDLTSEASHVKCFQLYSV